MVTDPHPHHVMDLWSVEHGRHGPTVGIGDHPSTAEYLSRSLSSLGWILQDAFLQMHHFQQNF